jgi:hypothetical protein
VITVRRWLEGAHPADGGLVFPGLPAGAAADLVLRPEQAELRAADRAVELSWTDLVAHHVGATSPGWWSITFDRQSKGGGTGVGVAVDRPNAEGVIELDRQVRRPWDRLRLQGPRSVPLCRSILGGLRVRKAIVVVLCGVLAERPEVRQRLGDEDRVTRLAADLARGPYEVVMDHTGVRRVTVEVLTAMRLLGYQHQFTRPLPGDPLPTVDEAVVHVRERLAANPYAATLDVTDDQVRTLVRRRYLDVDPWPFGALTVE